MARETCTRTTLAMDTCCSPSGGKEKGEQMSEVDRRGRRVSRGETSTSCVTQGARRSYERRNKEKRKHSSESENESNWEPSMHTQTSRSTQKTRLLQVTSAESLEMSEAVNSEVAGFMNRGYNKRWRTRSARGGGNEIEQSTVQNLEVSNRNGSSSQVCKSGGGEGERLLHEQTQDDEPVSAEHDILSSDIPGCMTIKLSRHPTANCEDEALSDDEDEYLFCDKCKKKYHGDCPVHGSLSELDPTAGYDQASLTYTKLPVPAQLTIRPSGIDSAGLGVFAVSFINKDVQLGPYEGRKVAQEDIVKLHSMAYAWQVRLKGDNAYLIDGQDPSQSNWMRFVNCAQCEDEQNVLAYQYHGSIYYRTIKTIYPKTELLVWYGEIFAKQLEIDPDTEVLPPNFYCRGCGGSFSEEISLRIHLKHSSTCAIAHPQTFTCHKCHQHFTQFECLKQHIIKHGNLVEDKQCFFCGTSFNQHRSLQAHLRTHTSEKPYKCVKCGKNFIKKHNLQKHLSSHTGEKVHRTHTSEKPYKCVNCGKNFIKKHNLQKHLSSHTGEKASDCVHSMNSHLQQHLSTHTGDKPYKCVHCGKNFRRNFNLQEHLRSHTGDKPYKCIHCGKNFSRNGILKVHLRTHTGDKPYECMHCGKKFGRTCTLQLHLRTHTGDKPYKCMQCGKKFGRNCTLQLHVRTHTGDKPYKCMLCGRSFGRNCTLQVHLRKKRHAIQM